MEKIYCKMVIKNYQKKEGTKTIWELVKTECENLTEQFYNNCTNNDTIKFFRRLGGIETVCKGYTKQGYLITNIASTSPDREKKTVREFSF